MTDGTPRVLVADDQSDVLIAFVRMEPRTHERQTIASSETTRRSTASSAAFAGGRFQNDATVVAMSIR